MMKVITKIINIYYELPLVLLINVIEVTKWY
jgi:hypothetical protein